MHKQNDKHEFAIYHEQQGLQNIIAHHRVGDLVDISDDNVVTRIRAVLRLEPGESIILFNDTHHISATITAIKKSSVAVKIDSITQSVALAPAITMLLPILKRDAMEQCLAAMCELGVNNIQPIITAKSQRSWPNDKDLARAHKIIRASAEQCKQFAMPEILPTISLEQALGSRYPSAHQIFFDVAGTPLKNCLEKINQQPDGSFVCIVGPEGDFATEEKRAISNGGFLPVQLTPTVLRSWQAAFLGVGIVRSYVRQNVRSY